MRLCNPSLGMRPASASGGEVYERELLGALENLQPPGSLHIPAAHGKTPERFPQHLVRPSRGLRWWAAWGPFALAIRRCWKVHGFDVLRCHSAKGLGPACLLAKRLGVTAPLIVHHHHIDPSPLNVLDRWVLRRADLITVDSEYAKSALRAEWRITGPIEIVPAGLRPDQLEPPPPCPTWATPRHRFVGLWMAEFKPRKNVEWLIRLWPSVLRKCPDAFLLLTGDGPGRRRAEQLVVEFDLPEHIGFSPGFVPERQKAAIYAAADFFLFPSLMEGFGMPVLEAMAQGRPCLVSDRGALPERVGDGHNGFVLSLGRPEAWAEAIRTLRWDYGWQQALSARARQTALGYSWESSARRLVKLMEVL